MYRIIFTAIIATFLTGCKANKFPSKIESKITNEHFRLKGTKLFAVKPKTFEYSENVNLFKYNDSVLIHCLYIPGNYVHELKKEKIDFFYNKNYQVVSREKFKINADSGVYYHLIEGNSNWLYFKFGDTTAMNLIVACYPLNSSFQDTVYEFVENLVYKQDYNLNPIEIAKFDITGDGSGFKFAGYSMNQFIFYEDSAQNYNAANKMANHISIAQLPVKAGDTSEIKNSAIIMNLAMKNQGIVFADTLLEKEYRFNNSYAYKLIIRGSYLGNNDIYMYEIATGNSNVIIFFNAVLYHDGQKLIPIIEKIGNSLVLY